MIERILVIKKRQSPAHIMQKSSVLSTYKITENKLNSLIETGDALDVDGKPVCFDIPIKEAYEWWRREETKLL